MNIIEKSVWLHKVPKDKRSDLKLLLSRNNFHEIKDIGNEDYVINIVNQDYVVDRENCDGEIYILSASSRYEIKNLRYSLRFGEKNELILLKPENLYLTESEDISLDRYMVSFCSTIKRELDYQVSYGVKIVEPQPMYNMQPKQDYNIQHNMDYNMNNETLYNQHNQGNIVNRQPMQQQIIENTNQMQGVQVETNQNNSQVEIKSNQVQVNSVNKNQVQNENVSNYSTFDLDSIYSSLNAANNAKISLTAYCRDGVYGVNIDVNSEPMSEIEVVKNASLDDIDRLRALTTCIFMAQGLGSYLRLRNSSYDIKFFYYEDKESSVQPPENFVDLSVEISKMMG